MFITKDSIWCSTFDHVNWGGEHLHLGLIFPLVLESTYERIIESATDVDPASDELILDYRFLSKDCWIFLGWGVG